MSFLRQLEVNKAMKMSMVKKYHWIEETKKGRHFLQKYIIEKRTFLNKIKEMSSNLSLNWKTSSDSSTVQKQNGKWKSDKIAKQKETFERKKLQNWMFYRRSISNWKTWYVSWSNGWKVVEKINSINSEEHIEIESKWEIKKQ